MKLGLFLFLTFTSAAHAELPRGYQKWNAEEKLQFLWESRLVPSEWSELPELKGMGWDGILSSLKSLGTLGTSFDHKSDEMPTGRTKMLHPYGSVGVVELVPYKSAPFTGIFEGGFGLARLSLAGAPDAIGYTPGMALKFFVDGERSRNIQVMNSLNGQGNNQNFFEATFTNILPEPNGFVLRTLGKWFALFVKDPLKLTVEHLAQVRTSGQRVTEVVSPAQIYFVPQPYIHPQTQEDFRLELSRLRPNTVLYKVYGSNEEGGEQIPIGRLVLRSQLKASRYGDHQLFFQHERSKE